MPENPEEIIPAWMDEVRLEPGTYVWTVAVEACEFRDLEHEKPYANLSCIVIEGEQAGYKFDYRLYVNQKARSWAMYFLKKFDYPEGLLAEAKPILRRAALVGLQGKMLAEVGNDPRWGLQINIKAFDHTLGTEIEDRLNKKSEVTLSKQTEPVIDLEQDVKTSVPAGTDLSWLDAPVSDTKYHATDDDLPEGLFGEKAGG